MSVEFGIPGLSVAPEDHVCAGDAARSGGHRLARVTGEAAGALRGPPAPDELTRYGRELSRSSGRYPRRLAFMEDLTRCDGGILVDLRKMYPTLPFVDMVIDPPHDLTPDEFRAMQG